MIDPWGSGLPFESWNPEPVGVVSDMTVKASFASPVKVVEIADDWQTIIANVKNGTYREKYKLGNYKRLDLGKEGVFNMQIVAFDTDIKEDGSKAPISWLSMELMKTNKRWNPRLAKDELGEYVANTGTLGGWESCELRQYYQTTLYGLIPQVVKAGITAVRKVHPAYFIAEDRTKAEKREQATIDTIWTPSKVELTVYGAALDTNKKRAINNPYDFIEWNLRSAIAVDGAEVLNRYATAWYNDPSLPVGVVIGFCF